MPIRAALRLAVALALCGLSLSFAHPVRADAPLPEPFDVKAIDRAAQPCRNFFAYATGTYLRSHPIPPAYTEYGYIEQLEDRTRAIVRDILVRAQRDPGGSGSNAEKIGRFYGACMDTAAIERRGLAPLLPELTRIAAIQKRSQLPIEIARLHGIGVDAAFALSPTQDYHDSSRTIGEIDQAGLGLPERDYYVRTDRESRALRAKYETHVATMLALGGDSTSRASARAIVALETRLARAAKPIADLREPESTYHPMTVAAITQLAPHVALRTYLTRSNVADAGRFNVAEPAFLRSVDREVANAPLATWKAYLRWHLLDAYAPTLAARFDRESFAFRERTLNGAKQQLPRWKRCVAATDLQLGEAVGAAYVAKVFPRAAKASALALALRIKRAYRQEIEASAWMTPATRKTAGAKLTAMGLKVGYPTTPRSYAGYAVGSDSYAANVARGATFARKYELARIGHPTDRRVWFMTPQTVNAYNDTTRNEIVLPAAQLQRPFFDPRSDDASNLGATGAGTIGHEMTHGFDDEGHKFDLYGNLRNWWTPHDGRQFDARAQCVIRQFDRTVAVGDVRYQGRLVAGEAIADLGGVVIGYRALETELAGHVRPKIDGFSAEQRYFLAFAQSWSEQLRPQAARNEALGDPHPLPRDRVNLTLANVPAWYAAFNCPKPPQPICEVW